MILKESRLMTGYGAPAGGPPVATAKTQPPLFDMIAAGLGVVTFILGFFDWYGVSGAGTRGFAIGGAAVAGLSLLASLVAAAKFVDAKAEPGFVPLAASVSAVLVAFGMLVSKPQGNDAKPALIIALIVTLVQAALFVVSWLQASGRMGGGAPAVGTASTQWGAPQQYGQPTYSGSPSYGAHGGAQPGAPPAPPGYGQSGGYGQQQPSPSGGYSQPQPGTYPGTPPQPASPPPSGYGAPSTGYAPPSSPPPASPPAGPSAPASPPPSSGYPQQPGSGGYGQS
jgi:hypothetical protein